MEMCNGSEQLITETYMIPGAGSNLHLRSTPPLEEIGYMSSEVAPEFVFDQGLYYPTAANYYGYYGAGYESPGEWDDHHRFFRIDGQDLHYSGLQTESMPYVYYTPSYGYAQSPYNPYNPYIPGATVGLDGPLGAQQYLTNPSYQQPVSSAYFPVAVQSGSDVLPISSSNPSLLGSGTSAVNRSDTTVGISYIPSPVPSSSAAISQRVASGNPISEPSHPSAHQSHSLFKRSGGSFVNTVPSVKQPSSRVMTRGNVSLVGQDRSSSCANQETEHLTFGRGSSCQNPLKVTMPVSNGFTSFSSHVRGSVTADKFKPRFQYNGALNNINGSADLLSEQNRGPRTSNQCKGSSVSSISVRAFTTKAGAVNAQGNITISLDQYNRDDFPVVYPDAKFFVIKSYSEDDVHKSIKYNVWSSTPNGNKRLDSAYDETQRISVGKPRKCPIFLFFSVNASGQFCGVAEMIGPVDFSKDMDFWHQDKWTGSFSVKWHIVKDVPNTCFRHIILENNENKPVTNSRDTQEIPCLPGMNMLSIFKNSPVRTSILDDFVYYEERQRIMYEEKCRLRGRNYVTSIYYPAAALAKRLISSEGQNPNSEGETVSRPVEKSPNSNKEQLNCTLDQLPKADNMQVIVNQQLRDDGKLLDHMVNQTVMADGHLNGRVDQPPKADGKHSSIRIDQSLTTDRKQPNLIGDLPSCNDEKQPVLGIKKPLNADGKQANGTLNRPPKADGKHPRHLEDQPTKIGGNPTKISHPKTLMKMGSSSGKDLSQTLSDTNSSNVRKDSKPVKEEDANGVSSIVKIGSLSIDSKIGEADCLVAEVADGSAADVVTVGSVHIKVKKSGESSGILTVGSIPIDPKGNMVRK